MIASAARRMSGQDPAPVPVEEPRLPAHRHDVHLILEDQRRPAHAAGAGRAARRCRRTDSAGGRGRSRRRGRATSGRQAALPRDAPAAPSRRSDTPGGRRRGERSARRDHRHVDAGLGQRARLLVGDGPHSAAIGGKDRRDVRYAHHLEVSRRSALGSRIDPRSLWRAASGDGLLANELQPPVSLTHATRRWTRTLIANMLHHTAASARSSACAKLATSESGIQNLHALPARPAPGFSLRDPDSWQEA